MGVDEFVLTSSGLTTSVTAYTSGDVLGTEMTMAMSAYGGTSKRIGGKIIGATIADANDVIGAVDLFFFKAASTPAADNAPNAWSDANWLNLVGVMSVATTVIDSANNKAMVSSNSAQVVPFVAAGSLFVVAVTRTGNAFFAAGTDLQYRIFVES